MVNNTEDDQSASCMNDLEQLIETLTLEPEEEDIAKIQTMADTVKTSPDLNNHTKSYFIIDTDNGRYCKDIVRSEGIS
ncbi:unnamed protein product [Mytilus coruscus]|uniref:Uncharacterized protein n=1 Tax=Mytilus coruscus TaxID=42192 RepID=A0A6J8AEA6_MYTCO|nr:unnamed protein product [Mytilus coruscus]